MSRPPLAKNPEEPENAPRAGTDVTFLDHARAPYWFGVEANSIVQFNPSFHAPYSGKNSLGPGGDGGGDLGLLHRLHRLPADPHDRDHPRRARWPSAAGSPRRSASPASPTSTSCATRRCRTSPTSARFEIHQIIPLSNDWEVNEDRGPISSFRRCRATGSSCALGKMSTADLFDINPAGSDSHMQFMNWTVDNNGAYDYAADTRGYTYGVVVEYQGPYLEARFGEMLMPTVANGDRPRLEPRAQPTPRTSSSRSSTAAGPTGGDARASSAT